MPKATVKRERDGEEDEGFPKGSSQTSPLAKRVRASAATSQEPEFVPDQRNMDDLWRAAFPVGTEWDQLDNVYNIQWDFSNLEKAFEEGGVLFGKKAYLFGCTEPQLVPFEDQTKVVCIPVVVAVVSPFPPSDKIGIKSVQMEGETIVPMKEMKMDWVPYIPFEDRHAQLPFYSPSELDLTFKHLPIEHLKSQIFTLKCTQRRAALKQLNQERIKKYEYCLPCEYLISQP
eukprot:Gb_10164 [translate_table: standard]